MTLSANGKRIGRPSKWSPEFEERICDGLLEGNSLVKVCANDDTLPSRATVCRRLMHDEAFEAKCARARAEQADLMDDQILDVALMVLNGKLDPKAGSVVISALQWRASKLKPKKYGDSTNVKLTDADGGPVQFAVKSILDEAGALSAQPSNRLLEAPKTGSE